MRAFFKYTIFSLGIFTMAGCSVFGKPGVEIAPYELVRGDGAIEIRKYERLVLVSTSTSDDMNNQGDAFGKLFGYISGDNKASTKIEMTAPVIMDPGDPEGQKIDMTAPVLMNTNSDTGRSKMSFVLPATIDYENAPTPTNPDVELSEVRDLTVATIKFSGRLTKINTQTYRTQLERWIEQNDIEISGPFQTAGYNPPWTLPSLRRNEILIPIKLK